MTYGTYPFYARFGFRITVRTAEDDAALIAYRHRPEHARIQIFFIQRKSAKRTIRKRIHLLSRTGRFTLIAFRQFNKILQRKDNDKCRTSDQNIIEHTESIARFEQTRTDRLLDTRFDLFARSG